MVLVSSTFLLFILSWKKFFNKRKIQTFLWYMYVYWFGNNCVIHRSMFWLEIFTNLLLLVVFLALRSRMVQHILVYTCILPYVHWMVFYCGCVVASLNESASIIRSCDCWRTFTVSVKCMLQNIEHVHFCP